jgi:hypothetical protein
LTANARFKLPTNACALSHGLELIDRVPSDATSGLRYPVV